MPADQAKNRLAMLVQGLFDHMNAERSQVISGIGRYARKQLELAERLRGEVSQVDALRAKPDRTVVSESGLTRKDSATPFLISRPAVAVQTTSTS